MVTLTKIKEFKPAKMLNFMPYLLNSNLSQTKKNLQSFNLLLNTSKTLTVEVDTLNCLTVPWIKLTCMAILPILLCSVSIFGIAGYFHGFFLKIVYIKKSSSFTNFLKLATWHASLLNNNFICIPLYHRKIINYLQQPVGGFHI